MDLGVVGSYSMRSNQRAFTLNELLVTVAVIGVLSAIALPRYADMKMRATLTGAKVNMVNLANATQEFYLDHGHFPHSPTYDSRIDLALLANGMTRYLDRTDFTDPFQRPAPEESIDWQPPGFSLFASPQSSFGHGFVYINYRDFIGEEIPTIQGIGIYSLGPDRSDSLMSLYPLSEESKQMVRRRLMNAYGELAFQPIKIYNPSNGLYSSGDFGMFRGEFDGFIPRDFMY